MGRWTQYDEDEYRLPEGMVRIGYDADTQQYTFRDTRSGSTWEGAPGCEYGRMTKISAPSANRISFGSHKKEPLQSSPTSDVWSFDDSPEEDRVARRDIRVKTSWSKSSWKTATSSLLSVRRVSTLVSRVIQTEPATIDIPSTGGGRKDADSVWCRSRHHTVRRHVLGYCTEPRYSFSRTGALQRRPGTRRKDW